MFKFRALLIAFSGTGIYYSKVAGNIVFMTFLKAVTALEKEECRPSHFVCVCFQSTKYQIVHLILSCTCISGMYLSHKQLWRIQQKHNILKVRNCGAPAWMIPKPNFSFWNILRRNAFKTKEPMKTNEYRNNANVLLYFINEHLYILYSF